MNDGTLGRSAAALVIAIGIHAIPLALIDIPEPLSPAPQQSLSIQIGHRRVRPPIGDSVGEEPTISETTATPDNAAAATVARETEAAPEAVPPVPSAAPSAPEVPTLPESGRTPEPAPAPPSAAESPARDPAGPAAAAAPNAPDNPPSAVRGAAAAGAAPSPAEPLPEVAARRTPPPAYPESARREGRSGTVEIELLLDRRGRVQSAEVVDSSGHSDLDEAALAAVRRWLFERGQDDRRTRRRFEFRLESAYTP